MSVKKGTDNVRGIINEAFAFGENSPKERPANPEIRSPTSDFAVSNIDFGTKFRSSSFRSLNSIRNSKIEIDAGPRSISSIDDLGKSGMTSQLTQNILNEAKYLKEKEKQYQHTNHAFVATEVENIRSQLQISDADKKSPQPKRDETKPIFWTQILATVFCASVHLSVGAVVGFTGVTLPSMMDPESDDLVLSKFEASIFSSIVNIGAMFGSVISSLVMVWLGQRSTLLIFLPIGMLSWVILGFSHAFWLLLIARVVQGVVVGVTAGCANNYVVEFAHTSVRGRLFAVIDLSLQVGFFFVYLVGSSEMTWRNIGLVCGIISMAFPFMGMLFLPHSPRWLAMYGRMEEAERALVFYRGDHYNVGPEMKEIMHQTTNTSGSTSVSSQFKMLQERSILYRFAILAILLFASHFTGNFAMIAYSVSIFESANVAINPYLSTILAAVTRIVGVSIYLVLADKFGRRPLFMIPLFLSGVCMIFLGGFFYAKENLDDITSISWLPLTSIVFFTLFTCMSHPVLMLFRSELLPTSVRAFGVGLLYLAFFFGTFCVSISYPYMVDSIGSHWTFWIYGATSFLMVVIAIYCIPETKGKTLEEIGELFKKNNSKSQP